MIGGALALLPFVAGTVRAASEVPRTGAETLTALQTRRVSLSGATIVGDIDFRGFDVVKHSFSCRSCTIKGRVLGDDVVFDSTLDLSGAELSNAVLMRRATFHGRLLLGRTRGDGGRPSSFAGRVDFAFSRFDDLATFVGASFAADADFTAAQFRSASIFADAFFSNQTKVSFEQTSFAGPADFRQTTFDGPVGFEAAKFEGDADFSDAAFAKTARFVQTKFGRDATFLGALFTYDGGQTSGVTFGGSTGERDFVFDLAQFSGGAIFRQTVAAGSLSFREADLKSERDKLLVFDRASAQGLLMDVDGALRAVQPADRQRALRLIEAGAKTRGDLGVANDARFSLEVLKSREQPLYRRIPNVIFYRLVAGYFVRPLHPIVALLVLVSAFALLRVLRTSAEMRGFVPRASSAASRFGHAFLDALALIAPGGDATGRRIEALAYRLLIVCALIGLAQSNPTLREMFDALL
jgi:Pentapeptide repeats (9 copies)